MMGEVGEVQTIDADADLHSQKVRGTYGVVNLVPAIVLCDNSKGNDGENELHG